VSAASYFAVPIVAVAAHQAVAAVAHATVRR
jgi:hypothetical protein